MTVAYGGGLDDKFVGDRDVGSSDILNTKGHYVVLYDLHKSNPSKQIKTWREPPSANKSSSASCSES